MIGVAERGVLVSQVVQESRELCTHASGSEALALQYRIDALRTRYSNLATDAENKIGVLARAIPLSEDLREGFFELNEFLNGVEEDLENLDQVTLEEQFQLISTIESDVGRFREQLDACQSVCVELQRLVNDDKANVLAKESQEMTQRFNAVSEAVSSEFAFC